MKQTVRAAHKQKQNVYTIVLGEDVRT